MAGQGLPPMVVAGLTLGLIPLVMGLKFTVLTLIVIAVISLLSSERGPSPNARVAPLPPTEPDNTIQSIDDAPLSVQPPAAASPAPSAPSPPRSAPAPLPAAPDPPQAAGGGAILARLRAQREAARSKQAAKRVRILYASQTGTAQEIAREIGSRCAALSLANSVSSLDDLGFAGLSASATPVVVVVASSTGDGDPPDNAASFFAAARKRSRASDSLRGVRFALLGLADSNYTRFAHVPRLLRARLAELGAESFYPGADADEVDGIEHTVEPWMDGVLGRLQEMLGGKEGARDDTGRPAAVASSSTAPMPLPPVALTADPVPGSQTQTSSSAASDPLPAHAAARLFSAPLTAARWLTSAACPPDRKVLHVELDLSGADRLPAPGDAVGVLVENERAVVDRALRRLGLRGEQVFALAATDESQPLPSHLPPRATARHLFQCCADLCSPPRKLLLRLLAQHAAEPEERATLLRWTSVAGRDEAQREVAATHSTVLDVLERFPSSRPPFAALLDALPPLQPRLYSTASAPGASQSPSVAFALSLVDVPTPGGGLRAGVGSAFIARRAHELWAQPAEGSCEEESSSPASTPGSASSWTRVEAGGEGGPPPPRPALRVFLRPGGDFHPGEDPRTPLVMVGPGTGVAPFVGFLQDRQARAAAGATLGESWLFFGCRRPEHDYLYRQELEAFAREGALTHLHVAFSRAQSHKVYVQHLMREHRQALFDVLARRGGRVYVCGDGAAMARDVHAEIVALHRDCGGLGEAEAAAAVAKLVEERRYLRDIWS